MNMFTYGPLVTKRDVWLRSCMRFIWLTPVIIISLIMSNHLRRDWLYVIGIVVVVAGIGTLADVCRFKHPEISKERLQWIVLCCIIVVGLLYCGIQFLKR